MRTARRLIGFTLIELLVVIGIIAVLMGIISAVRRKRASKREGVDGVCVHRTCGNWGRSVLTMYANDNHGHYPRTTFLAGAPVVAGTGTAAPDPFGAGGPTANDVTAPLWLLARVQKLPTVLLICPYNDENEFVADQGLPGKQANFTSYGKNLGYSYANPYPDDNATKKGYGLTSKVGAAFPLAADLNPGINPQRNADVNAATPGAAWSVMKKANSENHEQRGQNVLYGDGHVVFATTALCGVNGDNIYTAQGVTATGNAGLFVSPGGKDDAVLLPVD